MKNAELTIETDIANSLFQGMPQFVSFRFHDSRFTIHDSRFHLPGVFYELHRYREKMETEEI